MFRMSTLWKAAKGWTQTVATKQRLGRQRKRANSTELLRLPTDVYQIDTDTSYRPSFESSSTTLKPKSTTVDDLDDLKQTSQPRKRLRKRWQQGWRFGAVNCALSASIVFVINFVVTVWGSVHNKTEGGILLDGDCDKVRHVNTGLHLLINILSTILLSSSNYCMQCLSAPTRHEIDAAHAKGTWLDIGVPSIRNLSRISRTRVILWMLLGLSSLPLHLFYNSAVFVTLSSNDYLAAVVPQSFIDDAECFNCGNISIGIFESTIGEHYNNTPNGMDRTWYFPPEYEAQGLDYNSKDPYKYVIENLRTKARNGLLDRLDPVDCIDQYSVMIQSTGRNVLVVGSDKDFPPVNTSTFIGGSKLYSLRSFTANSFLSPEGALDIYEWMCTGTPSSTNEYPCSQAIEEVKRNPQTWALGSTLGISSNLITVDYCLSEKAEPRCKLEFNLTIAIIVTLLNLFKAILIFYTVSRVKEDPIMNMGDAVASFLETEDKTTKGMCLLTLHDAKNHRGYFPVGPKSWNDIKHRWGHLVSKSRRGVTLTLFILALLLVSRLLAMGIAALPQGQPRSLPALAKLGYGAADPRSIIEWDVTGTISNVLVANLPQPILSFIYFSYNGYFTTMLLGYEWSTYAHARKGLRVSRAPTGSQRSTYFLQLPYRFALPLMALSGLLHWLVSQSIFLVAIDFYGIDGKPYKRYDSHHSVLTGNSMTCGYSPIAIVTVLVLGILMVVAGIGFGFVPYKPGMNLAGSCSAAISAACHNEEWDEVNGTEAARSKLRWGVVGKNADGVGHCTFSTKEVELPKVGEVYAG